MEYGPGSHEWMQAHPEYAGGAFYHPPTPPGGPAPPSIDFNAYSQDDPRMVEAYGLLKDRMNADNSKRAIDKAVMGTMDAAALGAKDLGANMARRGISGTGTGATFLQKNVYAPAQREAAGKASDIALAEQDRQDRLAQALQGPAGAISGQNLANRSFGLSAWEAQQQAALQRQQLAQQAQDAEIARWIALTQSMGGLQGFMQQGGVPPQIPTGGPGWAPAVSPYPQSPGPSAGWGR
jgi:hypothetical protein